MLTCQPRLRPVRSPIDGSVNLNANDNNANQNSNKRDTAVLADQDRWR